MVSREQAAAGALASLRLEGLEPSAEARDVLARWARGELSTDRLDDVAAAAAAGVRLPASATPDSE